MHRWIRAHVTRRPRTVTAELALIAAFPLKLLERYRSGGRDLLFVGFARELRCVRFLPCPLLHGLFR